MRNKLICTLLLIIFSALPVCGAELPQFDVNSEYYDAINDAFTISGTIKNEIGNVPLTLEIIFNGSTVYMDSTTAKQKDNEVYFEFEPAYMLPTAKTGTYTIKVRSAFSSSIFSTDYQYYGADYFLTILKNINAGITAQNTSAVLSEIKNNASALSIDYSAVEALSPDNKAYYSSLFTTTYTVPEAITSDADSEQVKTALLALRNNHKTYISMAEFFDIASTSDADAWFAEYSDFYGYTSSNNIAKYSDVTKTENFAKRITLDVNVNETAELTSVIDKYILLTCFEFKTAAEVVTMLSEYPQYFTGLSSAYTGLNASQKATVVNSVLGTAYADCAAAVTAINTNAGGSTGGGGSGGSGGGGGGGSWTGGSNSDSHTVTGGYPTEPAVNPSTSVPSAVFSDVTPNHWGYNAIMELYGKGVLSGYEDGTFRPDVSLTRAEFVKMLVKFFKLADSDISDGFNDVNSSHWAYKDILTAKANGLVAGDEFENFNPDSPITRQDVLVILHRVSGGQGGETTFSDSSDISDYAVSAVGYFVSNGTVKGMGNNMFMPLKPITRAEVSQILNKI